jgi:hypothetical protein
MTTAHTTTATAAAAIAGPASVTRPSRKVIRGSLYSIEDLHQRCHDDGQCWHVRTAHGKRSSATTKVWLPEHGAVTTTRAAWFLYTGAMPAPGQRVFRACTSPDCVRPAHLRCMTFEAWGPILAASGRARTPAKVEAARRVGHARSRITPEQRAWIIQTDGTISHREASKLVDMPESFIGEIRRRARRAVAKVTTASSSVFVWRGSTPMESQPAAGAA